MTSPSASSRPFKFGALDGRSHDYDNSWSRERTAGPERLVIAPSHGHVDLLMRLSACLPEPFGLLYVLLVPRSSGREPGRYQSPEPTDRAETESFLRQFAHFLERDGRHHLWLMSLPGDAILVYDNHNVIYAYGPLSDYEVVLRDQRFHEADVTLPVPHEHHYNVEFDSAEEELMDFLEWKWFPLAEDDDN